MAKLPRQRAAYEVADDALQIHGGAGYMKEYGIERAVRDTRLGPIGGGTDEIMKEILGTARAVAARGGSARGSPPASPASGADSGITLDRPAERRLQRGQRLLAATICGLETRRAMTRFSPLSQLALNRSPRIVWHLSLQVGEPRVALGRLTR